MTLTDWNFSIPPGATIQGITVRSMSSFDDVSTEDQIRLTKLAAPIGDAKVLNGPGTRSAPICSGPIPDANGLTVGGPTDLWGTTWTRDEVNSTGFGVFYDSTLSNTALDGVAITINYLDAVNVTVNQAVGQADPARSLPISFTAVFSEDVTGFTASDVDLSRSHPALAVSATRNVTGSGNTYTVLVGGLCCPGEVVVEIGPGAATGVSGFTNGASTSNDNSVMFAELQGDSNSDFVLSVADVFYDLRALFAAGPAAPSHADCNGDGVLTIADVFWLISHLFSGGPAPV